MYVSEETFAHLRDAADERQRRELEYRRIAQERDADPGTNTGPTTTTHGFRHFVREFRRTHHLASGRLSHP